MAFPLGGHHTKETKEKMRKRMLGNKLNLGRHPSAETRHKMSQARTARETSDVTRQKISQSKLGHPVSAETRIKLRLAFRGKKYSSERNAQISATMTGRRHTTETKLRMSEIRKSYWQDPEQRVKILKGQRARLKVTMQNDPEWLTRRLKAMLSSRRCIKETTESQSSSSQSPIRCGFSQERRAKIGANKKQSWQDPEWRDKVIRAQIEGRRKAQQRDPTWRARQIKAQREGYSRFPNKAESILLGLLEQDYPNEWSYVGNGALIIGNRNPDFANVNGQKELIELFGSHWHKGLNPQDRIGLFKKFGFRTLVIWEHELKELDKVRERIAKFTRSSSRRQLK